MKNKGDTNLEMDEAQKLFKKYSPLTICVITAMILWALRVTERAALILVLGFALQIFWSWRRHRKR